MAKTRRLRFDGEHDTVDMRPVVGFRPGTPEYESEDAQKFVFHRANSKTNQREGNRQYREGVEMTEEQALEILTSPYRAWGFVDITDLEVPENLPLTMEGLSSVPLVPPPSGGVGDYDTSALVPAAEQPPAPGEGTSGAKASSGRRAASSSTDG